MAAKPIPPPRLKVGTGFGAGEGCVAGFPAYADKLIKLLAGQSHEVGTKTAVFQCRRCWLMQAHPTHLSCMSEALGEHYQSLQSQT